MSWKIKCPRCDTPNPINIYAEGNVGPAIEGKPLPKSKKAGPKYECRNPECLHRF